jgi:hypothetical protein
MANDEDLKGGKVDYPTGAFWPACRSSLISVVVAGFPAMPHSPLPTS